jgi:regulation of enolase protein 1 (concanavalin A-like superfamily)
MVVSVVTRDVSDDANAWVVHADAVWLRISNLAENLYAFHAGNDGRHWDFVRHFTLTGPAPMRFGLSAQAPVGSGCVVTFTDLSFADTVPTDLRDGS